MNKILSDYSLWTVVLLWLVSLLAYMVVFTSLVFLTRLKECVAKIVYDILLINIASKAYR